MFRGLLCDMLGIHRYDRWTEPKMIKMESQNTRTGQKIRDYQIEYQKRTCFRCGIVDENYLDPNDKLR